MAINATTTGSGLNSLSNEVAIYYEKRFLERARAMLVHQEGGQMRGLDGNNGKQIIFNRFSPMALATTPLAEGSNPVGANLTSTQVNGVLAEYGNSIQVSRLLSTTDIDDRDKEKIDVVAQNMGETLDAIVRNALYNGATSMTYAGSPTSLTPALVAQAVSNLKGAKALMYPGTFGWLGKIQPETEFDIMQSTVWQNAAIYSNVGSLYEGEVGALYGVRFLVTNQGYQTGTTPVLYSNFIHGREAFGVYDNSMDPPKLYIVTGADTANPAERFHVISWAGQFLSLVLNSAWIYNIITSASIA